MQKKIKNRDEWNEANDYKVFHELTCATCLHFIFKAGIDRDIQGMCNYMGDEGLRNNYVNVTACCKRHVRNRDKK